MSGEDLKHWNEILKRKKSKIFQDSESPCGSVGECVNTPGGYECFCQPGYLFDGVSCFDLDEVSKLSWWLDQPSLLQICFSV